MSKDIQPPLDANHEGNRRYADERVELLEVIREIVDQEIEAKLKQYLGQQTPPSGNAVEDGGSSST